MDFKDAMDALKKGKKVTRDPWSDWIYFQMDEKFQVKSFQPRLDAYVYNENTMISEGWLVIGEEKKFTFCEIIPFLLRGRKAKLSDWEDCFIYLDKSTSSLILRTMDIFSFKPDFHSFCAQDWRIVG
jgi:hypothetical protein